GGARCGSDGIAGPRAERQSRVLPAPLDARQDGGQPRRDHRSYGAGAGVTRVGLVAKPDAAGAADALVRLIAWLGSRGLPVVLEKETAGPGPAAGPPERREAELP